MEHHTTIYSLENLFYNTTCLQTWRALKITILDAGAVHIGRVCQLPYHKSDFLTEWLRPMLSVKPR